MTEFEITAGDRTVVVDADSGDDLAAAVAQALADARQHPSRVEITNGGRQVIVEADRDMTDVANLALQLYRDTDDAEPADAAGAVVNLGFHTAFPADDDDVEPEARTTYRKAPL